ncbi:MAG: CoA-acylating methylmalonate-semialdehyde dehydrogenase [Roseitalea porphyridii]
MSAAPEIIHNGVGGAPSVSASTRRQPVFNPATGEAIAELPLSTVDELDAAVETAKAALPGWAATPPLKRARHMFKFKELLDAHAEDIARAISREHGKTHDDALGEVARGIEVVEFACGIPHLLKGEFSRNVGPSVDSYSDRQPLGVVAGITPFNFPAMVPLWMFPVALACGNTFVLKPSERVPSPALKLAAWLAECGLPDGVFNVVQGDRQAVDALLNHPDVRAVSFVGSTAVAESIHRTAMANGKRVQALGGAKNHAVIMPDADMDMTADALMGAAFGSAGERCMAISVAVPVTDAVADALIERLVPKIEALKIGPASDPFSEMGPLITSAHLDRVRGYVGRGEQKGARLVVDGRDFRQDRQGYENGFFMGATLLDHVTPDMDVWKDEIFGPVLSVVRRPSYEEAVELIHRHSYANGTAVFTSNGDTARRFSQDIEVGMVGVNVPIPVPMAFHSFGGWKASNFGDHNMHGMEGIRFYTRMKTTTTRWPTSAANTPQFAIPTLG